VGDIAADGTFVTNMRVADLPGGLRQDGAVLLDRIRSGDGGMGRQGPHPQAAVGLGHPF
jgi:hypothetical protein